MKAPEDCESLDDVRAEIDRLDREVLRLWGQRSGYVRAAARFKTSEASVAAPERFRAMLQQRRQWAADEGLSPEVVESIYRQLVEYFITEEKLHWRKLD